MKSRVAVVILRIEIAVVSHRELRHALTPLLTAAHTESVYQTGTPNARLHRATSKLRRALIGLPSGFGMRTRCYHIDLVCLYDSYDGMCAFVWVHTRVGVHA